MEDILFFHPTACNYKRKTRWIKNQLWPDGPRYIYIYIYVYSSGKDYKKTYTLCRPNDWRSWEKSGWQYILNAMAVLAVVYISWSGGVFFWQYILYFFNCKQRQRRSHKGNPAHDILVAQFSSTGEKHPLKWKSSRRKPAYMLKVQFCLRKRSRDPL